MFEKLAKIKERFEEVSRLLQLPETLSDQELYRNLNKQLVSMEQLELKSDIEELKSIIEEHVASTGSKKGQMILDNFETYVPMFKKIIPSDYKVMLKKIASYEEKGEDLETAKIEAFKEFVNGGAA